jgi:hypothetical protein
MFSDLFPQLIEHSGKVRLDVTKAMNATKRMRRVAHFIAFTRSMPLTQF